MAIVRTFEVGAKVESFNAAVKKNRRIAKTK